MESAAGAYGPPPFLMTSIVAVTIQHEVLTRFAMRINSNTVARKDNVETAVSTRDRIPFTLFTVWNTIEETLDPDAWGL